MTLLELLVKELPKHGGWPNGYGVISTNSKLDVVGYGWDDVKESTTAILINIIADEAGIVTKQSYEEAIAAQQPVWDGEGLPPVGVKVEWLSEQYGWLGGTVAEHDAKYPLIAIIRHNDGYTGCHRHEIRTEADRKREEVIDCIANLIHRSDPVDDATSVYEAIAAGKIPGVELSK